MSYRPLKSRTITMADCRITSHPLSDKHVVASVTDNTGDLWMITWVAPVKQHEVFMAWERDRDDGVLGRNWDRA